MQGDFVVVNGRPPDNQTRCAHEIEHDPREGKFEIVLVSYVNHRGDGINEIAHADLLRQRIALPSVTVPQLKHRGLFSAPCHHTHDLIMY